MTLDALGRLISSSMGRRTKDGLHRGNPPGADAEEIPSLSKSSWLVEQAIAGKSFEELSEKELNRCLGVYKLIGLRLGRRLEREGSQWVPTQSFVNLVDTYARGLCRTVKTGVEFEKHSESKLSGLTDDELHEYIKQVVRAQQDADDERIPGDA